MAVEAMQAPVNLAGPHIQDWGRAIDSNEVAMHILGRKRKLGRHELSDAASCSSHQSQQTFLDGDSPISSHFSQQPLRAGERSCPGSTPPASLHTPPFAAVYRRSKRQRSIVSSLQSASHTQASAQHMYQAETVDLPDQSDITDRRRAAAFVPAGACYQLKQQQGSHDEAVEFDRRASWPHLCGSMYAKRTAQPASTRLREPSTLPSLHASSFATPANYLAPASHPLAPHISQTLRQRPSCSGAMHVDPRLHTAVLSALLSYPMSMHACKGEDSIQQMAACQQQAFSACPCHGIYTAAHRLPTFVACPLAKCQHCASQPPAPLPLSSLKLHDALASTQHMQQAGFTATQPAAFPTEQQAQLHLLCDQLLSKTMAAVPAGISPTGLIHSSALVPQSPRIPAYRGPSMPAVRYADAMLASAAKLQQTPQLLPAAVPTQTLLAHWAGALDLHFRESVFFALHLWQRLQDKAVTLTPTHRKGMLAACLWVSTKHEECRRTIPNASRIAAVLGVTARDMNVLELSVLGALGWNPLARWDDGTHSKGQLVSPHNPDDSAAQEIYYV